MNVLSRAWPDEFEARVSAARELSQLLGDDHDLAILEDTARSKGEVSEQALEDVVQLCRSQQSAVRDAAEFRAARLFAESPRAFTKRIANYWAFGRRVRPLKKTVPQRALMTAVQAGG